MNNLDNKGIALVMVLLMLIVVGGLSGTLLIAYTSNISQSNDQAEQTKAFYAAEGGLNYLDQYISYFNQKEGSLGFYLPYQFDNRIKKIKKEIKKLNNIVISDFNISFDYTPKEDRNDIFMVDIIAKNSKNKHQIKAEYRIAPSNSSFFGHTLAAREIELENYLTIDGGYSGEGDFAKIATAQSSNESDLGWDNNWDSYNYYSDAWNFPVYLRNLNNTSDMKEKYKKSFKFYGDNNDNFYLPENEEADKFTELVRSVNFREVLFQNGLNNYDGVSLSKYDYNDDNLAITNINPDDIKYKKLSYFNNKGQEIFPFKNKSKNYFLNELNGYFKNINELVQISKHQDNKNLGPYLYIDKFDYKNFNNLIDLTNFKTVSKEGQNEVIHLYINDDLDFKNKRNDLTFTSNIFDKKSVVVQSGGKEINLANGHRITYRTNSGIQGMGYYAPNATLRLSGDFTGRNISGWGHSYNVNKIKFEGNHVILPELTYNMKNSGLQGNIHPDIASYFYDEEEKELSDKFAGEVFRRKWKSIN